MDVAHKNKCDFYAESYAYHIKLHKIAERNQCCIKYITNLCIFFLFENAFHVLHGSPIITDKNVDFQNVFNYILLKQDLSAIIFA